MFFSSNKSRPRPLSRKLKDKRHNPADKGAPAVDQHTQKMTLADTGSNSASKGSVKGPGGSGAQATRRKGVNASAKPRTKRRVGKTSQRQAGESGGGEKTFSRLYDLHKERQAKREELTRSHLSRKAQEEAEARECSFAPQLTKYRPPAHAVQTRPRSRPRPRQSQSANPFVGSVGTTGSYQDLILSDVDVESPARMPTPAEPRRPAAASSTTFAPSASAASAYQRQRQTGQYSQASNKRGGQLPARPVPTPSPSGMQAAEPRAIRKAWSQSGQVLGNIRTHIFVLEGI